MSGNNILRMRKLELVSDNIAFQWRIQRGAKETFVPLREREREREREIEIEKRFPNP